MLADGGCQAAILGGGTDLVPRMKRRQENFKALIDVGAIRQLSQIRRAKNKLYLGAGLKLSFLAQSSELSQFAAFKQAAGLVATPAIRNQATLGGNLCIPTRCVYFDRSDQWRESLGFCLRHKGLACRAAPGSAVCLAPMSSDLAPVLVALGAQVQLVSRDGERAARLEEFYKNDGKDHLQKSAGEILAWVAVESGVFTDSVYLKLSRRHSFEFPSLGVAVALSRRKGTIDAAKIVLGSIAPYPVVARESQDILIGGKLSDELIAKAAGAAARQATPVANADLSPSYRRKMIGVLLKKALHEIRQAGS